MVGHRQRVLVEARPQGRAELAGRTENNRVVNFAGIRDCRQLTSIGDHPRLSAQPSRRVVPPSKRALNP
jgi:tRNA A37 methylthiotransferase MiaB